MKYVAFEIGLGGPKQPRRPAADLLQERNRKLDEAHVKIRFELAFRPTGNYVLTSDDTVSAIASALHDRLNRKFVVFAADEFLGWLTSLEGELSVPPKMSISRVPNLGAVMDMDTAGGVPGPLPAPVPPIDSEAWTSNDFAVPRVRGVWKNDLRGGDGRLDPNKRDGGWGALSQAMKRVYGGDWTARSLSTLVGLTKKLHTPQAVASTSAIASKNHAVGGQPGAVTSSQGEGVSALLRSATRDLDIAKAIDTLLDAYESLLEAHEPQRTAIDILVQARGIAERFARDICRRHGLDTMGRQFLDLCRDVSVRNLLTDKAQTYLNTLRKLGNFATHEAKEGDVQRPDVEAVLWMLLALVSEARPTVVAPNAAVGARLQQVLRDPALVQLYRELAEEDVALAEEGVEEYDRQLKSADGA